MTTATVVGAGIAGLTAAVGLHRAGWSVRVLEQESEVRASGTAVLLRRATVGGLESLGLGAGVRTLAIPLTGLQVRTRTARPVTPSRPLSGAVLIERSDLVGLLRESLPEAALLLDHPVRAGSLPRACAEASLVVGADGIHSTLRDELFGSAYRAAATGTTVWRGTAAAATSGLTEYWGRRRRFGTSTRPGGGTNWYATAVLRPPRGGSARSDLEELRSLFGDWNASVDATIDSIRDGSVLRHGITHLARRLPRYHQGNVALIGDAAHAMTPDLGRGANEAVLDALCLVRNLQMDGRVDRALAAYDRSRRPATQRAATASAVLHALIHRVPWTPMPDTDRGR